VTGALTMLTRGVGTPFDGTLVGEALLTLQEQFLAFATALTALGI
jgi:hypothetical protein